MGIAPSHFERDLDVLNDPSFEEREKDRTTERAKQRAMTMHSIIGFEGLEDIPGDLECSICAEVSVFLYLLCFLFLLFEDAFARACALGFGKRERGVVFAAFPAMMLKITPSMKRFKARSRSQNTSLL